MSIYTLIVALLIALVYCGWPIIGSYSGLTGGFVGVFACAGTLLSVLILSVKEFGSISTLAPKAVLIMLIAGVLNGAGVYVYSMKAADKTIPTATFIATVCIFMAMAAPIQHWIINGIIPTWRQAIGYGLAALAVYFLK